MRLTQHPFFCQFLNYEISYALIRGLTGKKIKLAASQGDLRSNKMEIYLVPSFGMRTTHGTHTNVFQYAIRMGKIKNKSEKELPTRIQVVFQAATIL